MDDTGRLLCDELRRPGMSDRASAPARSQACRCHGGRTIAFPLQPARGERWPRRPSARRGRAPPAPQRVIATASHPLAAIRVGARRLRVQTPSPALCFQSDRASRRACANAWTGRVQSRAAALPARQDGCSSSVAAVWSGWSQAAAVPRGDTDSAFDGRSALDPIACEESASRRGRPQPPPRALGVRCSRGANARAESEGGREHRFIATPSNQPTPSPSCRPTQARRLRRSHPCAWANASIRPP
jgi:hypothetical protein